MCTSCEVFLSFELGTIYRDVDRLPTLEAKDTCTLC